MFHIHSDLIKRALDTTPAQGKRSLEPIKTLAAQNNLPIQILEDKEIKNDAEIHMKEGDLWCCLQGEVRFICGGELVDPWFKKNANGGEDKNEIKAKEIRGGSEVILKKGDWLWIPPGEAHQHICLSLARLAIIKIPQ